MKKLLICLLCFVTLLSFTGCFKKTSKKNNSKNPDSQEEISTKQAVILDDQTVGNVTFEGFNITTNDENDTYIDFDVTNNTETAIDVNRVKFTLYVKGEVLATVVEPINKTLEPGESYRVLELSDVKLSNVDEVKYELQ